LNIEKSKANMKIIDQLQTKDGRVLDTQKEIMKEQVRFFKDTYTIRSEFNDRSANEFIQGLKIPLITDDQKNDLDSDITKEEITVALKLLNNDSAPGLDGLTTSFYKVFWSKIVGVVHASFVASFADGELSTTQKQAVLTLIHKGKDLPRDDLGNWRPISLTNTDYKILAKCLSTRLSTVINDIVHENQVGFMKGRKISTMVRLIDDTIDYMNNSNKPGMLLAVDFRRAFDNISKDFILFAFEKFGFGDHFKKWTSVLTSNSQSCINYTG